MVELNLVTTPLVVLVGDAELELDISVDDGDDDDDNVVVGFVVTLGSFESVVGELLLTVISSSWSGDLETGDGNTKLAVATGLSYCGSSASSKRYTILAQYLCPASRFFQ